MPHTTQPQQSADDASKKPVMSRRKPFDSDSAVYSRTDEAQQRENDVLVNMMGADSRRIDDLVGAVGEVRGDVTHLRGDVGRVVKGVDDLRDAMTILSRHAVLMETQARDIESVRLAQRATDARLTIIENVMPGLIELRLYAVRGVIAVMAAIGLAMLALVIKK